MYSSAQAFIQLAYPVSDQVGGRALLVALKHSGMDGLTCSSQHGKEVRCTQCELFGLPIRPTPSYSRTQIDVSQVENQSKKIDARFLNLFGVGTCLQSSTT
jgi:hypothetical protein